MRSAARIAGRVAIAAAVLLLAALPAHAFAAADPPVSIVYSGSEDATLTTTGGGSTTTRTFHADWSESKSGTMSSFAAAGGVSWPFTSLNGSITSSNPSCTGMLSGPAPAPPTYNENLVQVPSPASPVYRVQLQAVPSWSTFTQSSAGSSGPCGPANQTFFEPDSANSDALTSAWSAVWSPTVTFQPGTSSVVPLDFVSPFPPDVEGPLTTTLSVTFKSTLAFSSGAGAATIPPGVQNPTPSRGQYGPWRGPGKTEAADDLKAALERLVQDCYSTAQSAGLVGTGVLLGGTAPLAAGILIDTAAVLGTLDSRYCAQTLTRVVKDYKTYSDPPDANFTTVPVPPQDAGVRFAPCPQRAHAYCVRLRAAAVKLSLDTAATTGLTVAAEQAISRETAAVAAGDQAAVTLQDNALHGFSMRLRAAARAQSAAGAALARVLRSAHLRYRLSAARSRQAIDGDLARLAAQGVPTAALRTLAPSVLVPGAADLLAGLARQG